MAAPIPVLEHYAPRKPLHVVEQGVHQMPVREEAGHAGVRYQIANEGRLQPKLRKNRGMENVGGMDFSAANTDLALQYQRASTSRQWAPAAQFPGQQRPGEPFREVKHKNLQDFSLMGRNIGPHNNPNAVGGHVGMDKVAQDLMEKFTQRTKDDITTVYKDHRGPTNNLKGDLPRQDQGRMWGRAESFKNTPGRFGGAFRHEIKMPGNPQEELWRSGKHGYKPRYTSKNDEWMVKRQRLDEAPNRPGLRMQYFDNYGTGWERLENNRRMQHTRIQEIDHEMLRAYHSCPYAQPLGIVPPR